MKLRVLAFALAILAFFIFVGSPFQQAAQAVAGVDDAIIAIIIAGLAAIGITFVTTGAFDSLNDYVASLFNDYAEDHNTTVGSLLAGTQIGSDGLGRILVNNKFVVLISLFGAWLKQEKNLVNYTTIPVVSPGINMGNCVMYGNQLTTASGDDYYIVWTFAAPVYLCVTNNSNNSGWWLCVISNTGGTVDFTEQGYFRYNDQLRWTTNRSTTLKQVGTIENIPVDSNTWWQQTIGLGQNPSSSRYYVAINDYHDLANALNNNRPIDVNNVGINIVTDGITLPLDDSNYTDGDGAIIDVGADWGTTIGEIVDDEIPDAFSDGKEGEATITYESDEVIEEKIEDTLQQTVSQEVSDYQVSGLTTVFPFCIPFDLYNFVACLAADPVAPSFTWRFYVPGICDESIEIDLSEFNAAAQILRTMELLLFCVGLAFVTRKIIRG